jgi:high-affinity iron transporter
LFFVSFWLLSKSQAQAWQSYIEGKIQSSLSRRNLMALWSAAFLAVYREGAETILFYAALAGGADQPGATTAMAGGFAVGSVALVGVYLAMKYGAIKLPIRTFFTVTGNFLYLLAFIFAGKAVLELQAAGAVTLWTRGENVYRLVFTATPVDGFPIVDLLGIYPTLESLSLQGLMILLYVIGLVYQKTAGRRGTINTETVSQ